MGWDVHLIKPKSNASSILYKRDFRIYVVAPYSAASNMYYHEPSRVIYIIFASFPSAQTVPFFVLHHVPVELTEGLKI